MTLVWPDHPFLMLHLCFIQSWIFFNFYKCALSSLISLSSKYWRKREEKKLVLICGKGGKKFFGPVCASQEEFSVYILLFFLLEKCVAEAPSAVRHSAASLFRAAGVLSKTP